MKGFIEITPRWYSSDFLDMEGQWTIQEPEMININSIVRFGKNFIQVSSHPESRAIQIVESYEEVKKLILKAINTPNQKNV